MSAKLDKMREEWRRAQAKQDLWTARAGELEARYKEQENLEICEVTHSFHLTPDQLAELLSTLKGNLPENAENGSAGPTENNDNEEEQSYDNEEAER